MHEGAKIDDGSLGGILDWFAPYRQVDVVLDETISDERLREFGELESREGRNARLFVRREQLTRTVQRLLGELTVLDLRVQEPSVERIVGRLFREGSTATGG